MVSLKEHKVIHKNFTWRGLLIALCMPIYDKHYWKVGTLKSRMWIVHISNYIPDRVPILKAAKHAAYWLRIYRGYYEPAPTLDDMLYRE
jgi:hypothetical protein